GLGGGGGGTADVVRDGDGAAHELLVRRLRRPRVVLEPDSDVAAALERGAGDAALEHVAAEHGDRPGDGAVPEQLEVRVERSRRRTEPEAGEETLVAAEVELHH